MAVNKCAIMAEFGWVEIVISESNGEFNTWRPRGQPITDCFSLHCFTTSTTPTLLFSFSSYSSDDSNDNKVNQLLHAQYFPNTLFSLLLALFLHFLVLVLSYCHSALRADKQGRQDTLSVHKWTPVRACC